MQPITEAEEKAAFAALLLREADSFKAALALHPHNTNRALRIAQEWKNDPEVLTAVETLRAEGASRYSKSQLRDELTAKMLTIVDNEKEETEDRIKAATFIANLHALIEKPATIVNNNTLIQPKVIEVPSFGTVEEWESAAEKQQRELLSVSRSRH